MPTDRVLQGLHAAGWWLSDGRYRHTHITARTYYSKETAISSAGNVRCTKNLENFPARLPLVIWSVCLCHRRWKKWADALNKQQHSTASTYFIPVYSVDLTDSVFVYVVLYCYIIIAYVHYMMQFPPLPVLLRLSFLHCCCWLDLCGSEIGGNWIDGVVLLLSIYENAFM